MAAPAAGGGLPLGKGAQVWRRDALGLHRLPHEAGEGRERAEEGRVRVVLRLGAAAGDGDGDAARGGRRVVVRQHRQLADLQRRLDVKVERDLPLVQRIRGVGRPKGLKDKRAAGRRVVGLVAVGEPLEPEQLGEVEQVGVVSRVVDQARRRVVRQRRLALAALPLGERGGDVGEEGGAKGARCEQVKLKGAVLRHKGGELHHLLH
mmetsp:Transcript_1489/g.4727  ORF Transcript_1489/g.4727 Transcript_1489/m.4727 type:complete len:206 (+) Transcript_1489:326-943(+)